MADSTGPLRVAIVNDYEIVVAGVAAALEPFSTRVKVVELDSQMPVLSRVDIILYDTFGQVQGDGVDLEDLLGDSHAKVVIFSWNTQPELVERAMGKGASGYLAKELPAADMVSLLERIGAGERVRPSREATEPLLDGAWPGREHGLTAREAEVIALISQGLSNQQIAETTYLSINSVKTYIRAAYRKIEVTSRSQAVIWGLSHGFEPDRVRRLIANP